jgi:2-keto-4-pentenoate hydratase/2-oxohepta-3-ene-1,7-dioic acid hydratase in catechol pathway
VSLLARFLDPEGHLQSGLVEGDTVVVGEGDLLTGVLRPTSKTYALGRVKLLAPVMPSKVVAVARNYADHAKELGNAVPAAGQGELPKVFLKPSTSVVGPGDPIVVPPGTERVDHEAELGVVIGRTLDWTNADEPMKAVAGYTCLNDVTARDFQRADVQFTRGKGFDSFCPLGPWLATGLDASDLRLRGWVDDELRQDGRTKDMLFDVPTVLRFIARIMTLHPGDVIATGTPAGVGPLRAGQRVRIEIEGIGTLENPVVDRADR